MAKEPRLTEEVRWFVLFLRFGEWWIWAGGMTAVTTVPAGLDRRGPDLGKMLRKPQSLRADVKIDVIPTCASLLKE